MAKKVLNLDKLVAAEQRVLEIGGVEHPIREMTVDMFIQTRQLADKLEGETDMAVQLNATIDTILLFVPSLKRTDLGGKSLEVLAAVVAFVRGEEVEDAEAAAAEQAAVVEGK